MTVLITALSHGSTSTITMNAWGCTTPKMLRFETFVALVSEAPEVETTTETRYFVQFKEGEGVWKDDAGFDVLAHAWEDMKDAAASYPDFEYRVVERETTIRSRVLTEVEG